MSLPLPKSNTIQRITTLNVRNMTKNELLTFMGKHGFNHKSLAEFLGITPQAVTLWIKGQRDINLTTSKLLRMLDKYPYLLKEF